MKFVAASTLCLVIALAAGHASADTNLVIDAKTWRVIPRESGPVNYYSIVPDPAGAYVTAQYQPPWKTAVLGYQIPDGEKEKVRRLKWSWRAQTLPVNGDECAENRGDSAAVVYVIWKRGLRHYTLKYVWSSVGKKGAVCDRKRNLFVAQDTIVLESGPSDGTWVNEEIDLAHEFRAHFENGDPKADVPEIYGIGIMTDGDQTRSPAAADYGTFFIR